MINLAMGVVLAWTSLQGQASATQSYHMSILFNGSPGGDSTFSRMADGTFSSNTTLAVGTVKIVSQVDGKFKGDRDFESYIATSGRGGPSLKIELKGNEMLITPP